MPLDLRDLGYLLFQAAEQEQTEGTERGLRTFVYLGVPSWFSRIRRLGLIEQAGKFGNANGVFLPSAPSAVKGSRPSTMPSAVTFASWSAAKGRGCIGGFPDGTVD